VLNGKGDESDVSVLKTCMQTPEDGQCTSAYSAPTSIPNLLEEVQLDIRSITPALFREKSFGNHTYRYYSVVLTWTDAEAICQETIGGHLASIHSKEEIDFIFNDLMQGSNYYSPTWLGGYTVQDAADDSVWTWTWTDGSEWNYSNWADLYNGKVPNEYKPGYLRVNYHRERGAFWYETERPDGNNRYVCKN